MFQFQKFCQIIPIGPITPRGCPRPYKIRVIKMSEGFFGLLDYIDSTSGEIELLLNINIDIYKLPIKGRNACRHIPKSRCQPKFMSDGMPKDDPVEYWGKTGPHSYSWMKELDAVINIGVDDFYPNGD